MARATKLSSAKAQKLRSAAQAGREAQFIAIRGFDDMLAKLDAQGLAGEAIGGAFDKLGHFLVGEVKTRTPVDSGRARRSISHDVSEDFSGWTLRIGSDVGYACVLGCRSSVVTKDGAKPVTRLKVGDLVLTQTGEFRPIERVWSFPVTKKPDLVDIEVEWRKERNHRLTVTADHKILVWRDGRNKWVEAGNLLTTDRVYQRKKVNHQKGTGRKMVCKHCGKEANSLRIAQELCSLSCRSAYWNAGNNPHKGSKRTAESRARMSDAAKRKLERNPDLHPSRIVAKRGARTGPEAQLEAWLKKRGVAFEPQFCVGDNVVDFYVAEERTIYEADGSYWHQDQDKDIERDKKLLAAMPGVRIIHMHFVAPRFTPDLKTHPLERVYYVPVNPNPDSYIEPETFEAKAIVSLRRWTYEKPFPKACVPKLYDLSVEGVHSFVANGLVVSNSSLEFGTGRLSDSPLGGKSGHHPPGPALDRWASRHLGRGVSGYVVARAIARRGGLIPKRMFRDTFEAHENRIEQTLDHIAAAVEREWGS